MNIRYILIIIFFLLIISFSSFGWYNRNFLVIGNELYYYGNRNGIQTSAPDIESDEHFYIIKLETGEENRILDDSSESNIGKIVYLTVSPDRKLICMVCNVGLDNLATKLVLFERKNKNTRILINNNKLNTFPVFSPDNKYIVFYSQDPQVLEKQVEWLGKEKKGAALMLLELASGTVKKLASEDFVLFKNSPASWSPDSKKIVFYAGYESLAKHIYIVDIDSENLRCLTELEPYSCNESPVWMADGNIYYKASKTKSAPGGIYVMNFDGKNRRLFNEAIIGSNYIMPSPDKTKIMYQKLNIEDGTLTPVILNLKGEDVSQENSTKIFGKSTKIDKITKKHNFVIYGEEKDRVLKNITSSIDWRY